MAGVEKCKLRCIGGEWRPPKPGEKGPPCVRRKAHRGPCCTLDDLCAAAHKRERWLDGADVNTLTRATICAPPGHTLGILDFSSVEARCNAWAAGDEDALEVFRAPAPYNDPYAKMAGVVYGVDWKKCIKGGPEEWRRALGKILELGCGYQLGDRKFKSHAEKDGVNWDDLPVTPKQAVKAFRKLHAPIVRSWRDHQQAAVRAVGGAYTTVGPFEWGPSPYDDGSVWMLLPAGRPLVYFDMRTKRGKWGPELVYWGRKGRSHHTYGGSLVENAIQATCRDLLARAIVLARREGYRCCLRVHDEGVFVLPLKTAERDFKAIEEIFRSVPKWAKGMPVDCEGFLSTRYKK